MSETLTGLLMREWANQSLPRSRERADEGPLPTDARSRPLIVYAFDVDDTLEISGGPVTVQSLVDLRAQGHVVGLCGNWAVFCRGVENWHHLVSFMNAGTPDKETLLRQLKKYVPADDFVLVGNVPGVSGASDDQGAAERAGWRFIKEADFARGAR